MKGVIDNFSKQAGGYKKFRPSYPDALYQRILQEVKARNHVWDCGTGNGQVAAALANYFTTVSATDISEQQLKQVTPHPAITYSICRAEKTNFLADTFDLITVAQAIHWFDFDEFYREAFRVSKPDGIIAVWGYGLIFFNDDTDALISNFYHKVTGPYWAPERKYIDEAYQTIPFPFEEINIAERFVIKQEFTLNQLGGYLNTWSSIQKFQEVNNYNPVGDLIKILQATWSEGAVKTATFPIFMHVGKITK